MAGSCRPRAFSGAGKLLLSAVFCVLVAAVLLLRKWSGAGDTTPVGFRDANEDPPALRVRGEEGEGGGGGGELPQCYSSPAADPSEGAWRKCERGIAESQATFVSWPHPQWQFQFLQTCAVSWNKLHKSEEPVPYWNWEPTHCSLDAVDADKFCLAMKGRKGVLLVGDSLSRLATTTLASILRAKNVKVTRMKDVWSACGGELTVGFMRNDYLDARKKKFGADACLDSKGKPADNTVCVVFADDDTLEKFDTLVVNSGAHFREAREYGSAMKLASHALAGSMKRLHGDDAILVVRNTPPGHWHCAKRMFDGPVDAGVAGGLVAAAPESYHWSSFDGHNKLLRDAFKAADGWVLLDAFSPTVLRADSHIGGNDCLHYCVPGPADHWITLLYNILLVAANDRKGEEG